MPARNLPPTLPDVIEEAIVHRAASPVLGRYERSSGGFDTEPLSTFFGRAVAVGRWLADQGVRREDVVAISSGSSTDALLAFVGACTIGAIPTITATRPAFDSAELTRARLGAVIEAVGGRAFLVVDHGRADALRGLTPDRETLTHPGWLDPAFDYVAPAGITGPSPCFYQLTSGSTGRPKPVVITHTNLMANTRACLDRGALVPSERLLCWLPLYHDMGLLAFAMLALVGNLDLFLMSPYDFLSDPSRWLQAMSDTSATMSASPTFGYELVLARLQRQAPEDLDLSNWNKAFWGAEPIGLPVVRRFVEEMARYGMDPSANRTTYGLAEATLLVALPEHGERMHGLEIEPQSFAPGEPVQIRGSVSLDDTDRAGPVFAACGRPVGGMDVWLAGAGGERLEAEDVCGEVMVEGPSVVAGYLRPDGEVEQRPGPALATGDLGFFHDGELYIVDRIKNIVIRNGVNYAITPVEDRLADAVGVPARRVMVIDSDLTPGQGRLTALVELERKRDPADVVSAVRAVAGTLEPMLDDLVVARWSSLPATTSGKKRHAEARRLLQNGDLDEVVRVDLRNQATTAEVLDLDEIDDLNRVRTLIEKIARTRGFDGVLYDRSDFRHDLGYDSLAFFELVVSIEDELDIAFAEIDLPGIRIVADLLALVGRVRAGGRGGAGFLRRLDDLAESVPQAYAMVTEQRGREVLIGDRWVLDFASCNYLGLDLHPTVLGAVEPMIRRWGVHPSWTRAVASPVPYRDLEERLAALVGVPEVVVFPTVTLVHMGVLPVLVGDQGTLLVDKEAHHSIQEAAALVRGKGARVVEVDRHDRAGLAAEMRRAPAPCVLALDGVYSMAGSFVELPELVALAEQYDVTLYVDDAHGLGIVGEGPTHERPWGRRGNGIVNHHGLPYDNIVYVAGLSKAYSSMAAFVTARSHDERRRFEASATMVFSGPIPYASLATALAGLEVNDREGDDIRDRLHARTSRLADGARALGFEVGNDAGFPIVNVIVGGLDAVSRGCDILWDHRLLITPAVFPAVPLHRGGLRFTVTADNTDAHIDDALEALAAVRDVRRVPASAGSSAATPEPGGARGGT